MGMTREEFSILVKGMKAVYPQPTFIPDKDAFDIWYALLDDIPYKQANIAVQKHITSSKFPPTVADIREKAIFKETDDEISELQAWSLVYKAICNSTYNAEDEYNKLPVTIQKAVGNQSNLKEWGQMPIETVQSVEQSHFIRAYRTVLEREKQDSRLPEKLRIAMQNEKLIEKKES